MLLKSRTGEPVHVALLSGHATVIGPKPTEVHPMFVAQAVANGCIPAGVNAEDVDKLPPPSEQDKPELLRAAIAKLIESEDPEALTGAGLPNRKKLSTLVGWNVTAEELTPVWQAMEAEAKTE